MRKNEIIARIYQLSYDLRANEENIDINETKQRIYRLIDIAESDNVDIGSLANKNLKSVEYNSLAAQKLSIRPMTNPEEIDFNFRR